MAEATPDSEPTPDSESASDAVSHEVGSASILELLSGAIPADAIAGGDASTADSSESWMDRLPAHARGLLRIRVPVQVTLASQRKSIQEIVELGPGSIVKFDRTCDEPLELNVGDRAIASGEVVKVGDKFGLRIGNLIQK